MRSSGCSGCPRRTRTTRCARAERRSRSSSASSELNAEYEQAFEAGIAVRIGVNTGEVVAGAVGRGGMFAGADAVVLGDAVNVAARLEQAAQPGEVLIGESTYRLVREACRVEAVAAVEAKGKSAPVGAYRLLGAECARNAAGAGRDPAGRTRARARPARGDVPCGCDRAVVPARDRRRRARRRKVEARGRAGRSDRARCAPGRGWVPRRTARASRTGRIGQIVREPRGHPGRSFARGGPRAARQDARGLGGRGPRWRRSSLSSSGSARARRPRGSSRGRYGDSWQSPPRSDPLVLVVDDIQWAERTLLDLLAGLPETLGDSPILIVCLARPEIRERAPGLGGDARARRARGRGRR